MNPPARSLRIAARALAALVLVPAILTAVSWGNPEPAGMSEAARSRLRLVEGNGVEYLLTHQDQDGSWGSSRWTGGVDSDPAPGAFHSFDVAVTALCLEALLPHRDSERVRASLAKAEAFLWKEFPNIRRPDSHNLPNIWSYCYGIQTLAELHKRTDDPARQKRIRTRIGALIEGLQLFETPAGGWFYYASATTRKPLAPSASFVNAAVLVALDRARRIGVEPDPKLVHKAVLATQRQRKPDSSFLYSMDSPLSMKGAMHPINRPAGSLGRSQAGNLALRLWGDEKITDEVLDHWLTKLHTRQGWLDMGRKRPIPHESHAAVAGYFYYFGHYYAGLCLPELPAAQRARHQRNLGMIIADRQEADGSWFDYPLYSYHKPYGTAFALMTLAECLRPDLP